MKKFDFWLRWESGSNWDFKLYHQIVEAETYEEAEKIATYCSCPIDEIKVVDCEEIKEGE